MPMQRGMNFSIRWKRQAGELMGGKKDRERFSIKFNENDPAHDAVIRLLEKQGPRSKAQFLVNAHIAERRTVRPKKRTEGEEPREEIDQATFALIADTMSAFRSS